MQTLPNKAVLMPTYGVRGYMVVCPECCANFHTVWCNDSTVTRMIQLICLSTNECKYVHQPLQMTFHPQIKYVFKLVFYAIVMRKHTAKWRAARQAARHIALVAIRDIHEETLRKRIISRANLW